MINDILDLAKIESGNMEVRLSEFRIDARDSRRLGHYLQATERKNIDLKADVEPDLPEMFQDQARSSRSSTICSPTPSNSRPKGAESRSRRSAIPTTTC